MDFVWKTEQSIELEVFRIADFKYSIRFLIQP